ncbi:hypothetical protein B0H66DRAFT_534074 [Apodospora peruviana]|uniref:Uncharacterized protein n=1 Tax=Apodospora peruviana TaxID=516989 RepID=A0AAE0HZP6_9PEZI|nr:hypothetical protein B0H66DRAFT_534074 [Apodospora peruviana]
MADPALGFGVAVAMGIARAEPASKSQEPQRRSLTPPSDRAQMLVQLLGGPACKQAFSAGARARAALNSTGTFRFTALQLRPSILNGKHAPSTPRHSRDRFTKVTATYDLAIDTKLLNPRLAARLHAIMVAELLSSRSFPRVAQQGPNLLRQNGHHIDQSGYIDSGNISISLFRVASQIRLVRGMPRCHGPRVLAQDAACVDRRSPNKPEDSVVSHAIIWTRSIICSDTKKRLMTTVTSPVSGCAVLAAVAQPRNHRFTGERACSKTTRHLLDSSGSSAYLSRPNPRIRPGKHVQQPKPKELPAVG